MIPASERAKAVQALDRSAIVTGKVAFGEIYLEEESIFLLKKRHRVSENVT
jgi:hypothetical protein